MKKILLTIAAAGLTAGAFGQGQVVFENASGSGYVTVQGGGNAAAGSYQVALLWFNGTSYQQIATYQTSASTDGPGFFYDGVVNVPTYTATGTFYVQGWQGNFANYAAALAAPPSANEHVGQSASFANQEGNPNATPIPGTPDPISGGTPAGGWNGNMVLVPIPEPTTIALGGLGAAALLLFRRRK